MFLTNVFTFLKGIVTKKVETETSAPEPVASVNIQGGTASLTKTVQTETSEIADTDLTNAITIVNNVRAALASPGVVLISDLIPVAIVGQVREDLVTYLPVVAASLANVKAAVDTADLSAQFNDVLSQIRFSPNIDLNAFEHALAAKLLTKITGGGVGWSIAVMAVEYFLKNIFKPAPVAGAAAAAAPVAS
jgi:hypothetical protein